MRIAKWASSRDEFDNARVGGILHNWEASLCGRIPKVLKVKAWTPPSLGVHLKFNVGKREAGVGRY